MMSVTSLQVTRDSGDPKSLTDLSDAPNSPETRPARRGGSRRRRSSERWRAQSQGGRVQEKGTERLVTEQMRASGNQL